MANDLCRQAISKRSLRLDTSGWQIRNFIPLSLVCSVAEQLLNLHPFQTSYQVFNLGGSSMSMRHFAKLFQSQASNFLGESLPLDIPCANPPPQKQDLEYCCNKLANFISLSCPKFEVESNELLHFCKHYFAHC